jgi:hypothetical protein
MDVPKAIAELKDYAAMGIRYHVQDASVDYGNIVPSRQESVEDLMRSVLRNFAVNSDLYDWLKGHNQRERDFVFSRVSLDPGAIEVKVQKALIETFNEVVDRALPKFMQSDARGTLINSDATDLYYSDLQVAFYERFGRFVMSIDEEIARS